MATTLFGAVVVVTGANGGLGELFVAQALARGATKVYATTRTPRTWPDERIVPLVLDVLDSASIAAAARAASDATIVINNAGTTRRGSLAAAPLADVRFLFDTNFFGALDVAQQFAPVLAANGYGTLMNVHSVLSWRAQGGAYSASKAALWSATNSLRLELAPQGTNVIGLYLGYTDTPMTADLDVAKNDPADVVRQALDGIEAGAYEVLADEDTINTRANLSGPIELIYPELAAAPSLA